MTSWTVTQTQRYKAAIEGAGITDWSVFLFPPATSRKWRLRYAPAGKGRRTIPAVFRRDVRPTALPRRYWILHGEADQRVPVLQGREFFVLLAERGKTVRWSPTRLTAFSAARGTAP